MSDADKIARLQAALEEAAAVGIACRQMYDAEANRYFMGDKPSWKRAATGMFDEIDTKPDEWAALARGEF